MFRVYNARENPKYKNGDMTEKEVFEQWLNNFEPYDEKDGKVSDYLVMSRTPSKAQATYESPTGVSVLVSLLHLAPRVEAKKIVSRLRFSLSQSPFFMRDLKQNFCPKVFAMPSMRGFQALCNYFSHYSGTDTQAS